MKKINILIIVVSFIALFLAGCKQKPVDKMEWWREARFGMFIHWGLYAIPAGEYKGQEVPGYGEWIMELKRIPVEEYQEYTDQFNPHKFDADEWVKMAVNAGMKYIVITAKHHDGFALFDSKVSDYDVMNTPHKRDIIAELSKACDKHGIVLGLYYSQSQDWAKAGNISGSVWDSLQVGDHDKYIDEIAVPQIKEILNQYGVIKYLFWDTPGELTKEQAQKFYDITDQFPNLIHNDRLIEGGDDGDVITPEQFIPKNGFTGKDWETNMTMNETWGYKKNDVNWKSSETLVQSLIDIASKGGNFLLNIGPKPDGAFPQASINSLKDIGAWMKINSESIYGTTGTILGDFEWGRCTKKVDGNKTTLYFHVFDFPKNNQLLVPGFKGRVQKIYPLAVKNKPLNYQFYGDNLIIDFTDVKKVDYSTVIALEVSNEYEIFQGPSISYDYDVFMKDVSFCVDRLQNDTIVRYTIDGTIPTEKSKLAKSKNIVNVDHSFVVNALKFVNDKPVGAVNRQLFIHSSPTIGVKISNLKSGLEYKYYERAWSLLPDFTKEPIVKQGISETIRMDMKQQDDCFGFVFDGFIKIEKTGLYQVDIKSDDGSRLTISGNVMDHDGIHGMGKKSFYVALEKGIHPLKLEYFEGMGGEGLDVKLGLVGTEPLAISSINLFHK